MVTSELNTLQFAHHPGAAVNDAVTSWQHQALSLLESPGGTVRIIVF